MCIFSISTLDKATWQVYNININKAKEISNEFYFSCTQEFVFTSRSSMGQSASGGEANSKTWPHGTTAMPGGGRPASSGSLGEGWEERASRMEPLQGSKAKP